MIIWAPTKLDSPAINVSIDGNPPWDRLSPDYQHGQIPVPGLKRMFSESVTGIMEGLKLIGPVGKQGKINPGYFLGPGRERPLRKEEWLLGYSYEGGCLNIIAARRFLLIPAYIWTVQNKCHGLIARLRQLDLKCEEEGNNLYLYDGGTSDQPHEFDLGFSPAAILVAYLRGEIEEFFQGPTMQ